MSGTGYMMRTVYTQVTCLLLNMDYTYHCAVQVEVSDTLTLFPIVNSTGLSLSFLRTGSKVNSAVRSPLSNTDAAAAAAAAVP